VRLGGNGDRSSHEIDTLLHADKPEALRAGIRAGFKANVGITNQKLNFTRDGMEMYPERTHLAVLHGVLQRFLEDAEETNRNVAGQGPGNAIMRELDFDLLLFCKFAAKTLGCCDQPEQFQLRRMQFMRDGVDVADDRRDAPSEVAQVVAEIGICCQRSFSKLFDVERQKRLISS